jgi:hypothetical protein
LFLVIKVEYSSQTILCFYVTSVRTDNINKFLEVEFFVLISHGGDDLNNVGISPIESNFLKNLADLHGVNLSTSILIKDKESISEEFIIFCTDSLFPFCRNLLCGLRASGGLGYGRCYLGEVFGFVHDGI